MSLTEKIDNLLNQYPHLSEQQAADLLGRSQEENIQELYPNLSKKEIQAYLKDKPARPAAAAKKPKAAKKELTEAQKAAVAKGKATKAAKAAAKSQGN